MYGLAWVKSGANFKLIKYLDIVIFSNILFCWAYGKKCCLLFEKLLPMGGDV